MQPLLRSLSSYLPITSTQYGYVSASLVGVSITTLCYQSPWGVLLSGLGALGAFAVKQTRQVQEERVQRKALMSEFIGRAIQLGRDCINHEGNKYDTEKRRNMIELLNTLEKEHSSIRTGTDDFREPFVGIQMVLEHVLSILKLLREVGFIRGAIHTAMPATPLCAKPGEPVPSTLTAFTDTGRILTVADRTISLRRLLAQENVRMFIVYPKGGLEKRKNNEQEIYRETVQQFPNTLVNTELKDLTVWDMAKSGATYLFTDPKENVYAFSIEAQQAVNSNESSK